MDRGAALSVREGEGGLTVAPKGRAEQREQRLILVNRQQLPVALRPSLRCEVEGHDADFAQKGFGHDL